MRHPYLDVERPVAIGHRGAAGSAPENTLPSFERALAIGAAILESDVRATRDGAVVLLHDERVDRTTDGAGRAGELTLAELKRLDAGYRFSPDGGRSFPFRGRGITVPTLDEAFAAFPEARFNLEIKTPAHGAVAHTTAAVAAAGRAERTLLTAADPGIMEALRAQLRACAMPVAVGASSADVAGYVLAALAGRAPPPGSMVLQVPPTVDGEPLVTQELVDYAHAYDVPVHVWTINDVDEMTRLLDLGVDGIVSDFPDRVVQLVAARARQGG